MTDKIHEIANASTPKNITVGNDFLSLATWAVGKMGSGAIFAGILCYAFARFYDDNKIEREAWLKALKQQTAATWYMADSIRQYASSQGKTPPNFDKLYRDDDKSSNN